MALSNGDRSLATTVKKGIVWFEVDKEKHHHREASSVQEGADGLPKETLKKFIYLICV